MSKKIIIFLVIAILLAASSFFISRAIAASNTYYVNLNTGDDLYDGTSPTVEGGGVGPKETITAAIDAAGSGDIVQLAAGEYTDIGEVSIDVPITIESFTGTWNSHFTSKITGNSTLEIGADNVIIDGLIFEDSTSDYVISSSGIISNAIIRDCRFFNLEDSAIVAGSGTNWSIINNLFSDIETGAPQTAIISNTMTNLQINDNTFLNIGGVCISDSTSTNLIIVDNNFYHIYVTGISLSAENGVLIDGNALEYANASGASAGIYLVSDSLTTGTVNITDNIISNTSGISAGTAIGTSASNFGGATININNNNLAGNTWGFDYAGTGTVNAENNWWGSSTGPYNQTRNPYGLGSATTDNVGIDFTPYKLERSWVKVSSAIGNIPMIIFKSKLYQVRRTSANHFYTRYSQNGHDWSAWVYGAHAYSDVAMAVHNGYLYQAIRGSNYHLYVRSTADGESWTAWSSGSKHITGSITMISFNGSLFQTVRGTDGKGYMRSYSVGWSSWKSLGTSLGEIETVTYGPGIIQAKIASNHYLYWRTSVDGVNWLGWTGDGGTAKSVSMVEFDGDLYQTKVGLDNGMYTRVSDGPWGPWVKSGWAVGKVAMIVLDDRIYQAKRINSNSYYIRYSFDGTTWTDWQADNSSGASNITMTAFSGELYRAIRKTNGYLYSTEM
jgi:hypothetical protein